MSNLIDFYRDEVFQRGESQNSYHEPDYDYQAAEKAGVKPDPETGHMPDTYKMPNHITFSDESQYHGKDGNEGGHWNKLSDDRWSFTPGKTNLENHSMKELREYFKKYEPGNVLGVDHVDTSHHVPLLASALMDDAGNHYGIAIDHRANIPEEYHKYLMLHEGTELKHMQNLIKGGMKPQEAYEEAHDKIATPLETAAVRADLGEKGLEKYKQTMRDAYAKAKEPSDRERHPDAHTTKYKLDEAALKGTKEGATQTFDSKFEDEMKQIYEDKTRMLKEKLKPEPSYEIIHKPGYKLQERWKDPRDIRGV